MRMDGLTTPRTAYTQATRKRPKVAAGDYSSLLQHVQEQQAKYQDPHHTYVHMQPGRQRVGGPARPGVMVPWKGVRMLLNRPPAHVRVASVPQGH